MSRVNDIVLERVSDTPGTKTTTRKHGGAGMGSAQVVLVWGREETGP